MNMLFVMTQRFSFEWSENFDMDVRVYDDMKVNVMSSTSVLINI